MRQLRITPKSSTAVVWHAPLEIQNVFDCSSGTLTRGLRPSPTLRVFPLKSMSWSYQTTGIPQQLYSPDLTWTQLDLLEDLPRVDFSAPPAVQVILPQGSAPTSFQFTGPPVPGGALPTGKTPGPSPAAAHIFARAPEGEDTDR